MEDWAFRLSKKIWSSPITKIERFEEETGQTRKHRIIDTFTNIFRKYKYTKLKKF